MRFGASQSSRSTVGHSTAQRQLAAQERLQELRRIAAHVATAARDRLVTVGLYHRLLSRRLADDPGSADVLAKIECGLGEASALIDDLLQFTAAATPRVERVRVRQLIDQVLAARGPQMISQGIVAAVDVPAGQTLLADRDMLGRSLANLVRNALDAMPEGGELVITSYDGPAGFELEIADSGPGLDPEARRHLFEPFFSTKSEGAGLGLAVVAQIVAAHGGQVTVQNCPEGGAAFTLRFPRQALEAAA